MKRRNLKRLSYTLIAGSFLVSSGTAIAAPLMMANAASTTTVASLADKTTDRKVTVTKYLGNNGARGDGQTAPTDTSLKALAGVKFTLTKVTPVEVKSGEKTVMDGTKYGSLLVNPSTTPEYKAGAADGIYYERTTTTFEGTTDADGKISWDISAGLTDKSENDGIYLLEETDSTNATYQDDAGKTVDAKVTNPAAPSFIDVPMTTRTGDNAQTSINYDIQVFPKNQSHNMNPTKSIEDVDTNVNEDGAQEGADTNDGGSIEAGQKFTWNADVNIPTGLYYKEAQATTKDTYTIATDADGKYVYNADGSLKYNEKTSTTYAADQEEYGYFVLSDKLDAKLTLNSVQPQFKTGTGAYADLDATDYEIRIDGKLVTSIPAGTKGPQLSVTLTQAGLKKVSAAYLDADGHQLAATPDPLNRLRVKITTTADEGFDGVIENTFGSDYHVPGLPPIHETETEKPKYYTGGFELKKTAKTTDGAALAGAKFKVVKVNEATKDTAGAFEGTGDNAGKWFTLGEEVKKADGSDYEVTTGDDGLAKFAGLDLNVVANPDSSSADRFIPADTYYAVIETQAPKGYELLKEPLVVKVNATTADDSVDATGTANGNGAVEGTVVNKPTTDLPFTGGKGLITLIILATTLGGAGVYGIYRSRKNQAETN